jgi:peroxiredoxin
MRKWYFLIIGLLAFTGLQAADGHQIKVKISGYAEPQLYLAYYYGDKQYVLDTADVAPDGFFIFKGEKPLAGGMYLIVMAPNSTFFQIIVEPEEQFFSIFANKDNPASGIRFEGSPANTLFYDYLGYLNAKRPEADTLRAQIDREAGKKKEKLEKQLEVMNEEVIAYQKKFILNHPKTLTAAIIKSGMPVDMPEFEGDEQTVQMARWRHTKAHFFDNINLADARLVRTPFLFERVDYFVNKLQIQHPDTLALAIDEVLEKMRPAEENFKYYLIHFLNFYARSNIVGMDAVYVHIADKYYAGGQAPWTNEEQLKKIIENANELRPLLIGKIAPNVTLQNQSGKQIALHDIQSEYTVLYFWRYDCGHCKKTLPEMKAFYEKFKNKGVKLVAVCVKFTDEVPECWKYVEENQIADWMHLVDPYHRSKYATIYSIKTTPQIYVLDKSKEILSKRIGAEQLEEVMDKIIEMKQKEKQGG